MTTEPPDYRRFTTEVGADPIQGPINGGLISDVVKNIISIERMIKLSGGDPGNINGVIDAQLDRLIVGSGGSERLAMYNLACGLGNALELLLGDS